MIVDYDKETDTVYISKQIDNRWIQVGLNRDEVNQIVRSHPYNPQEGRISKAVGAGSPPLAIHNKLIRQAERERVLDDGIARIQKRIDGIFDAYRGETNERLTERPYNMADGMGECILMLKTIRSSKHEGETG